MGKKNGEVGKPRQKYVRECDFKRDLTNYRCYRLFVPNLHPYG